MCAKDAPTDSELEQHLKDLDEVEQQLSTNDEVDTESDDSKTFDFDKDFEELLNDLE